MEANDEEFLDLEALEALLDRDDDDEEDSATSNNRPESLETKTCRAQEAEADSLEDFFNAASESEDEDVKYPTPSLSGSCLQNDPSPKKTPDSNSSERKEPNGLHNVKSQHDRKSSKLPQRDGKTSVSGPERKHPAQSGGHSEVDPSTKALQEEMARMQKQMLELQKLLESKTQVASPKNRPEEKEPGKSPHRRNKTPESSKKVGGNHASLSNSSSKKIFQEQIGKASGDKKPKREDQKQALKLLPESGSSLFFDAHPTNPSSSRSAENSKDDHFATKQKKEGPQEKKKQMERALFGDSDSDWDDLDGEEKQTLSEAGRDLKRIMNSKEKARVAHEPKFGSADFSRGGATQSWSRYYDEVESSSGPKKQPEKVAKNTLQCKASSTDQIAKPTSTKEEEEPSVTEVFSKIRIVNPLISSSMMKIRMEGRKMISIPRIHLKIKTQDVQGDWVTIGVVVSKSDPKTSSTGKPYSIWTLNDLEDLDNSVSFFLFGEVHKQLWKTEAGTVIGVLNPGIMDSMEKSGGEPAFTIKNPSQMLVIGRSKDLAWCTSRTKGGNKCAKFINRRLGDFCAYHVQAAYRKTAATRLELHGSVTGVKPKSFEQKIFSKDCAYMYGGQTFVPNSRFDNGKTKKGVTLSKLQHSMTEGRYQKVNTLSLHDIKPQNIGSGGAGGKIKEESSDTFLDMIAVPSPGSMNLVAHLKNNKKTPGGGAGSSGARPVPGSSASVQSITPKELMRKHQREMEEKRLLAKKRQRPDQAERDPLQMTPQLGKGLHSGREIVLDTSRPAMVKADLSKLKAIAAVRQKGGLEKPDPNAIKKTGEKAQERVKKRLEKDCGNSSSSSSSASPKQKGSSSAKSPKSGEPPKKKSKLLGDVDLNSKEVKSILKARSKHKGVLAEAEAEREEAFFTALEKKEMLEEKMLSVTSIEITVVTCKQCMYTAQSAKDTCKKEGHLLKRKKTKKRFFMCKKCKQRTYVIDAKFPTDACRKCGEMSYEKTSMCPVRSGPKLESEIFSLRGDEVKNLNSLDQKVYLNTVIDD